MSIPTSLTPSVERGLRFLQKNQLSYGEFKTYACPSVEMEQGCYFDSAVAVTTIVLHSIAYVEHPYVSEMTNKAVSFLTEEMSGPGLFRYYTSRNIHSIDFDLDDTACAAVALRRSHPFIVWGYNIGYFTNNRNEAGLFYTWLDGAAAGSDVESVVNANVVFYLGDCDETKSACRFLIDIVKSDHEEDSYHYYLDNMTLYYAISRAYANGVLSLEGARDTVVEKVLRLRRRDGSFGNELTTACAVCSLINFNYDDITLFRDTVRYIESQQRPNGSWPKVAMWRGLDLYYGSDELTTALCVEALARSEDRLARIGHPAEGEDENILTSG
jgi:hypothetical protein